MVAADGACQAVNETVKRVCRLPVSQAHREANAWCISAHGGTVTQARMGAAQIACLIQRMTVVKGSGQNEGEFLGAVIVPGYAAAWHQPHQVHFRLIAAEGHKCAFAHPAGPPRPFRRIMAF